MKYTGTKIQVMPEDIEHGIKGNCTKCPLALAIARTININLVQWPNGVIVNAVGGHTYVRILDKQYALPDKCGRFLDEFDKYGTGSVITFKIGELE